MGPRCSHLDDVRDIRRYRFFLAFPFAAAFAGDFVAVLPAGLATTFAAFFAEGLFPPFAASFTTGFFATTFFAGGFAGAVFAASFFAAAFTGTAFFAAGLDFTTAFAATFFAGAAFTFFGLMHAAAAGIGLNSSMTASYVAVAIILLVSVRFSQSASMQKEPDR